MPPNLYKKIMQTVDTRLPYTVPGGSPTNQDLGALTKELASPLRLPVPRQASLQNSSVITVRQLAFWVAPTSF
jgi:hypothetical protein